VDEMRQMGGRQCGLAVLQGIKRGDGCLAVATHEIFMHAGSLTY